MTYHHLQKVVTQILILAAAFFLPRHNDVAYQSTSPISLNIARKNWLLAGTLPTNPQATRKHSCMHRFYDRRRKTSHKRARYTTRLMNKSTYYEVMVMHTGSSHEKDACKKKENRGVKRNGGGERQYRHLHAIRRHRVFFRTC